MDETKLETSRVPADPAPITTEQARALPALDAWDIRAVGAEVVIGLTFDTAILASYPIQVRFRVDRRLVSDIVNRLLKAEGQAQLYLQGGAEALTSAAPEGPGDSRG